MTIALVAIIALAVAFDFINGFHDAANSIATVVSTRVLTPRQAVLWAAFFTPDDYTVREYAHGPEQVYDPNTHQVVGADETCYQYNFQVDDGAFVQQGTAETPIVYWLAVQAVAAGTNQVFGWKTSTNGWGDDAVFVDTQVPGGAPVGSWTDMHYPLGHAYAGQSINLAFVIPEPGTLTLLLGCLAGWLVKRRLRRHK